MSGKIDRYTLLIANRKKSIRYYRITPPTPPRPRVPIDNVRKGKWGGVLYFLKASGEPGNIMLYFVSNFVTECVFRHHCHKQQCFFKVSRGRGWGGVGVCYYSWSCGWGARHAGIAKWTSGLVQLQCRSLAPCDSLWLSEHFTVTSGSICTLKASLAGKSAELLHWRGPFVLCLLMTFC